MGKNPVFMIPLVMAFVLSATVYAQNVTLENNKSAVHKGSGGVTTVFPDVCKSPSPAGPVPIPYPNIGKISDTKEGSKKVKIDNKPVNLKNSDFGMSSDSEEGTKGTGKARYEGKCTPIFKPDATYPRPTYYKYLRPADKKGTHQWGISNDIEPGLNKKQWQSQSPYPSPKPIPLKIQRPATAGQAQYPATLGNRD